MKLKNSIFGNTSIHYGASRFARCGSAAASFSFSPGDAGEVLLQVGSSSSWRIFSVGRCPKMPDNMPATTVLSVAHMSKIAKLGDAVPVAHTYDYRTRCGNMQFSNAKSETENCTYTPLVDKVPAPLEITGLQFEIPAFKLHPILTGVLPAISQNCTRAPYVALLWNKPGRFIEFVGTDGKTLVNEISEVRAPAYTSWMRQHCGAKIPYGVAQFLCGFLPRISPNTPIRFKFASDSAQAQITAGELVIEFHQDEKVFPVGYRKLLRGEFTPDARILLTGAVINRMVCATVDSARHVVSIETCDKKTGELQCSVKNYTGGAPETVSTFATTAEDVALYNGRPIRLPWAQWQCIAEVFPKQALWLMQEPPNQDNAGNLHFLPIFTKRQKRMLLAPAYVN